MKQFLILAMAVLGMAVDLFSQNRSIDFNEGKTFAEIQEIAKKENKLIFMDFYTTWCGPCKRMDKEIYTNDSVADFYNSHFICIKIDAEKGEGVELQKKYEVGAYPSFLFVSDNGEMIHRACKARKTGKDFINIGSDALIPEKQFSKIVASVKVKDEKSLSEMTKLLSDVCMPTKKTVFDFLASQKDTDLFLKSNWELIRKYAHDIKSKEFKFLVKNQEKFARLYGDSLVKDKILYTYINLVWDIATDTLISQMVKDEKVTKVTEDIKTSGLPYTDQIIAECAMNYYNKTSNWARLAEFATSGIVEKYYWNRASSLAHIAYVFSENVSDTFALRKAVGWAERSIELMNASESKAAYESLLWKIGEIHKKGQ